ncbi:hypothetical protein ACFL3S_08030, partial [Gemmatimonadota bacterium]
LPEYRNLENNVEALREEGPEDRVFVQPERGRAHGVEVFAKSPGGSRFEWSGSYALSVVEDRVGGKWVPGPYDQRHAVNLQLAFRPLPGWSISAGWIYHSPWPYTRETFRVGQTIGGNGFVVPEFGPLNSARLSAYKRADIRMSREFLLEKGSLLVYLDIFNVLNRENAQAASHGAWWYEGQLITERGIHPQLEVMPSLGLRWVF